MVQIITLLKIPWGSTSVLHSWWNMINVKTLLPEESTSSTWRVVIHHFIVLRRASLFLLMVLLNVNVMEKFWIYDVHLVHRIKSPKPQYLETHLVF